MSVPVTMTGLSVHNCSADHSLLSSEVLSNTLAIVLEWLVVQVVVVITDGTEATYRWDTHNLYRKTVLYTIDFNNESEVDRYLDSQSDSAQESALFMVLCDREHTINILQKVNIHDKHYDEQGVLTYNHRWLIVTNTNDTLDYLENYVVNITHLSVAVIEDGAESLLYAAMWEPAGRKFRLSAEVVNGGLIGEVYPTLNYGLNGRTFLVTTKVWGPFVGKDTNQQGNARYSGFCIELLKEVAAAMNFTYIITEPPDDEFGDVVNGSWTGLIGQLGYKETDMMSAPASTQVNRERVMDGSFPFYIEETGILYKSKPNMITKAYLFIRPYKWKVWVCMTALVPSTGLFVWYLGRLVTKIHNGKTYKEKTVGENIWITYGSAFNQGATDLSKSPVIRAVLIFWILTCVIYAATYSSNLVALLAVEVERQPFNSLEELSVQEDYKFGVQGGTAYTSIIKNSPGVYKKMWSRMEYWDQHGFPVLSTSHEEHMEYVDEGGYAYFTDLTEAVSREQTSCDLRIFTRKLFPLQFVMGFQNNSAYTREASEIIMRLSQTGVLSKWKLQFWPKHTTCLRTSSMTQGIQVEDLAGLFLVTIILLAISVCIFCIEKLIFIKRSKISHEAKPSEAL